MERHLFLTGQTELHGSLVALNSMQAKLRENQGTGLIEVKVGAARQIVLSYANGIQAGVFLLENGQSRPFNLAELSTLWGGAPFSVCSVSLPDRAGRAIWLILESRKQEQLEVRDEEAWQEQLRVWEREKFSGAVEITSKTGQGFAILQKGNLLDQVWQSFAILLPVKTVGVMGDERSYENVVALRVVGSQDGMTADWVRLPYKILEEISNRIINEVKGVNRVVYDISSKPPSTIEWE